MRNRRLEQQITLSAQDAEQLAHAMRVLVSPLDFDNERRWISSASGALRTALGAELGGFVQTVEGRGIMSGNWAEDALREYVARWYATMTGDQRRRAARMTSWVRADVWPLTEHRRDPYYHEWCVPNGNRDSAGMCTYIAEGEVAFYVNATRQGAFPSGGRVALLLKLLQPSLAAGVTAIHGIYRHRADLRLLDAVDAPLGVFRPDGRLLHAVPRLARLLGDEEDGPPLLEAARRLVLTMMTSLGPRALALENPTARLTTRKAHYVLSFSLVESAVLGRERLAIVTVTAPRVPEDRTCLRERFGLTRRESEVAALLAAGRRNREIARSLRISVHTTRHHVERVLAKLGVASRSEATARLAQ